MRRIKKGWMTLLCGMALTVMMAGCSGKDGKPS